MSTQLSSEAGELTRQFEWALSESCVTHTHSSLAVTTRSTRLEWTVLRRAAASKRVAVAYAVTTVCVMLTCAC